MIGCVRSPNPAVLLGFEVDPPVVVGDADILVQRGIYTAGGAFAREENQWRETKFTERIIAWSRKRYQRFATGTTDVFEAVHATGRVSGCGDMWKAEVVAPLVRRRR